MTLPAAARAFLALRGLPLLAKVPDHRLEALAARARLRRFAARSITPADELFAAQVGFILSGRYRTSTLSPEGVGVTFTTLSAGETIGVSSAVLAIAPTGRSRIIADEAGEILIVPSQTLMHEARACPELTEALMVALATTTIGFATRVYELAALDVRGRLEAELLRLAARGEHVDGKIIINNAPSQASLGDLIGAAREAIWRALKELADDNLITFSRGVIEILDIERLTQRHNSAAGRLIAELPYAAAGDGAGVSADGKAARASAPEKGRQRQEEARQRDRTD